MDPSDPGELAALRAEVERLRSRVAVLETARRMAHIGGWQRDLISGGITVSPEAADILGLTGEPSLEGVFASIHPDDLAAVRTELAAALEPAFVGRVRNFSYRVTLPGEEPRWIAAAALAEVGPDGRPVRLHGTVVDCTGVRRAEVAKHEQDSLFHMVLDQVSDSIAVGSPDGRLVAVNDQTCRMLGYSRSELLAMSIPDLIPPEDQVVQPSGHLTLTPDSVRHTERRLLRKDGTRCEVEIAAIRLPGGRVAAVLRDVTERRRAERAVRESEQTLRELGANLPALLMVHHTDEPATLIYANEAWRQVLGRVPQAGESTAALVAALHPDGPDGVRAARDLSLEVPFDREVRVIPPGAEAPLYYRFRAFPILGPDGKASRIVGYGENITERRAVEQALRDSEARYRSVVLAMTDGIVVHGPGGEIVTANPAAERVLGLTLDQIRGRSSLDPRWRCVREDGSPFPGDQHPGYLTLKTGVPYTGVIMGVYTPDGELRWISVNSRRVLGPGEQGAYSVVASFTDITARKLAAEKIRTQLEEKEVLLREIHHRVRNNLQIISSLLHLQASNAHDPRIAEPLRESQQRVISMALIHQLLYQSSDLARIPFAAYAADLGTSLCRSYGVEPARVTYAVGSGEHVLPVEVAVPCGLLLNELVANALKHAFPNERRGTVKVSLAGDPSGYELVVSDDGVGLPADFEDRRRASLGSKLVDRLVEQLGGQLVRTSNERGTRYEIRFSVSES